MPPTVLEGFDLVKEGRGGGSRGDRVGRLGRIEVEAPSRAFPPLLVLLLPLPPQVLLLMVLTLDILSSSLVVFVVIVIVEGAKGGMMGTRGIMETSMEGEEAPRGIAEGGLSGRVVVIKCRRVAMVLAAEEDTEEAEVAELVDAATFATVVRGRVLKPKDCRRDWL